MTVSIKPIDPVNRAFFAGEVSGLDLRKPLSKDEVAAVHAGMDEFGVLVFHDQKIDDDQQLAFSRSLGPLEQATGDIAAPQDRRMSMDLNDISNLDKNNKVLARDDRRRLFGLGNQLWHSDSSFKDGAGQVLAARRRAASRRPAATPSSPTCARPTMRSTRRPSARSTTSSACTARSFRAASWASPTSPRTSA